LHCSSNLQKQNWSQSLQLYSPSPVEPSSSLGPRGRHSLCVEEGLTFEKQISSVVRVSFFQLRLLSRVKPFLSRADLEKAVHAFISSRTDYCNALYAGPNHSLLHKLQLVQNAAARLISNSSKHAQITPALRALHWRFRVQYKILLILFKAINGQAPAYIKELLAIYQPARTLRSSNHISLVVPRARYKKYGDRSFAIHGPKLWNSLPPQLQTISDLNAFKCHLKMHLYHLAFNA
ncbi:uncharacterized protein LOC121615604, partial [Chelmon rostratus]|uniref:uncharacterized protein LOC121615604 n=1 Tax=Chelmon rostratus TaxID=109905 RepID=UPI001BE869AC